MQVAAQVSDLRRKQEIHVEECHVDIPVTCPVSGCEQGNLANLYNLRDHIRVVSGV